MLCFKVKIKVKLTFLIHVQFQIQAYNKDLKYQYHLIDIILLTETRQIYGHVSSIKWYRFLGESWKFKGITRTSHSYNQPQKYYHFTYFMAIRNIRTHVYLKEK